VSHAVTREADRLYSDIRQQMHVAREQRRFSPEKRSSSYVALVNVGEAPIRALRITGIVQSRPTYSLSRGEA
jgi:hypothetical protein